MFNIIEKMNALMAEGKTMEEAMAIAQAELDGYVVKVKSAPREKLTEEEKKARKEAREAARNEAINLVCNKLHAQKVLTLQGVEDGQEPAWELNNTIRAYAAMLYKAAGYDYDKLGEMVDLVLRHSHAGDSVYAILTKEYAALCKELENALAGKEDKKPSLKAQAK